MLPMVWYCACGNTNNPQSSICTSCGSGRGNTKLEYRGNQPFRKGQKKKKQEWTVTGQPVNPQTGHPQGPTPAGHKAVQRMASVPDIHEDEKEQKEHIGDEVEFKQVLAPVDPMEKLKQMVNRHDKRKRSFDSLFGGPEHEYNGVL